MKYTNSLIKLAKKLEIKYAQDRGGMYGSGGSLINNPPLGLYEIKFKIPVTVPIIKNKKSVTDITTPFVRELSEEDIKLARKSWWGQRTVKPTSWHINSKNQPVLIDWPRYGDVSIQNKIGRLPSYLTPISTYMDDSLVKQDSRFKNTPSNIPATKDKVDIEKEHKSNEIKSVYSQQIQDILNKYNIKLDPKRILNIEESPLTEDERNYIQKCLPDVSDQDSFEYEISVELQEMQKDLNKNKRKNYSLSNAIEELLND